MKKKVLIIGPWVSGHIQQWLGDDSSFDYLIVTCHKIKPSQKQNNVKCYFIFNMLISFIIFPFFLVYNYLKFKPEIVHVHFLSSYGLLSCFLPRKKIISIWGSDFNAKAKKNKVLKKIYLFILSKYNIINSPGKHITDDLISYNISPSKIITLQYGIDMDKIDLIKKTNTKNRVDNKIVFASIRNWDNVYQIEKLITTWKKLNTSQYELWLFGKSNNIKCENNILSIAKNIDNIKIIGFLPHNELYSKLLAVDAFISIPKMDGTPLSVLECCYLELLPVVTDIPFYRENILTINKKYLSKNFSKTELSLILEAVANISDDEKNRIISINRKMVTSEFNLYKNRKIMLELYKKLI